MWSLVLKTLYFASQVSSLNPAVLNFSTIFCNSYYPKIDCKRLCVNIPFNIILFNFDTENLKLCKRMSAIKYSLPKYCITFSLSTSVGT